MARPKSVEPETAATDIWLYRKGEARLFLEGEAIPAGDWQDAPVEDEV